MLSLEQIRKYLRTGGNHCPFCGSSKIDSDPICVPDDDGFAFALVTCLDCEKKWKDFYKLITIEEAI